MTTTPTPTPTSAPIREVMTVEEVADYLQVSHRSIYNLAAAGEIPAAKVAGQWRFKKTEVDAWLTVLSRREYSGPDLPDFVDVTKASHNGKM